VVDPRAVRATYLVSAASCDLPTEQATAGNALNKYPVANAVWLGEHILDAELHVLPDEGHVSIGLRFREIFDDLISRSQQPDREGA
jgi:hypothetical protein